MKKKLFTVYDSKTEVYGNPFLMITRGEAIRGFTDVANDPTTSIYKYPADYTLFELGEFDDQTGSYSLFDTKVNIGLAIEFKNKEN